MNEDTDAAPGSFNHSTGWQSKVVAEHYDERRFTSLGGRIYDRMEKRAIAASLDIAQRISPVNTALDLACGTGRISEVLASRGFQLTCGDISSEMLEVARKRLSWVAADRIRFLRVDIYKVDQADDQFDCVSAFRLFQHLTSQQRAEALREMARISRRFVLINIMYTSPYYGAMRALRRALGRYTTRYTSTRAETSREIAYAGLKLIKSTFSQPGFNGNRVLLLDKHS